MSTRHDFTPGKKYYRVNLLEKPIHTFIGWDSSARPVWESEDGTLWVDQTQICAWEIHKEPQKGTVWVNVFKNKFDGCVWSSSWPTKPTADDQTRRISSELLACIEIPWVEGQGL